MRTIFHILVVTFLLFAAHSRCAAEISVENVSKERAKELGITFRTNTNGEAGIRVTLEFKMDGELKNITHVELQIGENEDRIASAQLFVSSPRPDNAAVSFSAYPAYLPRSSLMIVVYHGPKGDVGYRFNVKDFIELRKP